MGKMKDLVSGLSYSDNEVLNSVMTLPEAVEVYNVSRRALEYAIWQDKVVARMSATGGSYIILVASLDKRYQKRG